MFTDTFVSLLFLCQNARNNAWFMTNMRQVLVMMKMIDDEMMMSNHRKRREVRIG